MARTPVLGGARGPYVVAIQCMCSGVYLRNRSRLFWSSTEYMGTDCKQEHWLVCVASVIEFTWKRRQPIEKTKGSLLLRIFLCHLCFLKRIWKGKESSVSKQKACTQNHLNKSKIVFIL